MAVRTITTWSIRSELQRVRAEYAGQLNTLEALQSQEAALGEKYSEQSAMLEKTRAALTPFQAKAADLQGRLDILALSFDNTSEEETKLAKN